MDSALVAIHIVAGSAACIGMTTAWLTEKGQHWHRLGGRVFAVGMAVSLIAALIVALVRPNHFLLLVALFSGYFVYTGVRLAQVRTGEKSAIDDRVSKLMVGVLIAMLGLAAWQALNGNSMALVTAVFTVIAAAPVAVDLRAERWPIGKHRIASHITRMGGASIATVTAVLVVNINTDPAFLGWLLPTVVFTPAIAINVRRQLSN